jgi:hypothetical protein
MKKNFLTLFILFVISASLQAQIIKVAPISLAFGIINAGYEAKLGEKSSIYPSASFYSRSSVSGFGLGLQYRKYVSASKEFPAGFFLAPEVQYGSFKQKDFADFSYSAFSVGGQIGYQWLLGDNFTIEASIGPAYWIAGSSSPGVTVSYDGILPSIGFNLGYMFGK